MSRFLAPLASVLFAFLAWPVHALGKSGVRFVHAVPGAGEAELTVEQAGRTTVVGSAGYGEDTKVRTLRPGRMRWSLESGGTSLASGTATLGDAGYTAVAAPHSTGVGVRLYRDASRAPRDTGRVRVIHASPEFGTPDLLVDGKRVVRRLAFGSATPYLALAAGPHDLEAVRPGTRESLLASRGTRIPGGTTTSAIVIGTRGEPARVILVTDRVRSRTAGAAAARRTRRTTGVSSGSRRVARGDSLWSIAQQRLGTGASGAAISREVRRLWDLNGSRLGTGDPNLIFPGQTLRLG